MFAMYGVLHLCHLCYRRSLASSGVLFLLWVQGTSSYVPVVPGDGMDLHSDCSLCIRYSLCGGEARNGD